VEIGFFTEFPCPPGTDAATAFDESMHEVVEAERLGFDTVWLAEIHFQKDRSVLSSPLVVATAIAAKTERVKVGIAVQILPLAHPLRLAEEVATLDHLSKGRLDFGIGRSGLPAHYAGFNIPYDESLDRFQETLDILIKAWTEERFTYEGRYFGFRDVCVIPKPYQKPHPPLRVAATTGETYSRVGHEGLPVFVAVRTSSISEVKSFVADYYEGWRAAGHPGRGEVGVIVPVYVADTEARAREETEASTMHFFRSIGEALLQGPRRDVGERLRRMTYADVLDEFAIYGTADSVTDRLLALRESLDYTMLAVWMNVGGCVPHERVLRSMRLFSERVMPRLR
jgi:alkanesulfonate monooxygenase SsuD/methylene tetrahydromethanopterin reductase-like flavin-dependent oxidoreductase (luciferase family)